MVTFLLQVMTSKNLRESKRKIVIISVLKNLREKSSVIISVTPSLFGSSKFPQGIVQVEGFLLAF